jgi:hypothetical protein
MVIDMNEARLGTIEQVREFLAGTADLAFTVPTEEAKRRRLIVTMVRRFSYFRRGKAHRGVLFAYLQRLTGYSRQHLSRLLAQYRRTQSLRPGNRTSRTSFARKYGPAEVALLAELDRLHDTLSGPATKVLAQRAHACFGDARYARLAQISVSHLYNLRASAGYRKQRVVWQQTRPSPVTIGVRKAPAPQGLPGYIRIDTVHQGDRDGAKGVYHINAVDIVTQWQLVACCERISEAYLLPVIGELLAGFPFAILGFHSDGGREYVNHDVAKLLEKLRVEFTRSRPRHTNDNALVESKNGSVIRKQFGYAHIAQHFAADMNAFCRDFLNPYVNFHRPCYFALDELDTKGKIRKRYPHELIMTPFDKLATLPHRTFNLCPGATLASLDRQARQMTDNEAAKALTDARSKLFRSIHRRSKAAA